jgi:hypothetical protein
MNMVKKVEDENDNEEGVIEEQVHTNQCSKLTNSKKYTPINSYKPSGKLVYSEDLY